MTLAAAGLASANEADAKLSGRVHCYRGVCHRVLSLSETRKLVGITRVLLASAYDAPSVDRFNRNAFTSNGERFNASDGARVAAADLPDGTLLLLRNPENGRTSHVLVNDFGPFYSSRTIDATRRVANDLGFLKKGVTPLEVTVLAAPKPEDSRYKKGRRLAGALGFVGTVSGIEHRALVAELIEADEREVGATLEPGTKTPGDRGLPRPADAVRAADHALPSRDIADPARMTLASNAPDGPLIVVAAAPEPETLLALGSDLAIAGPEPVAGGASDAVELAALFPAAEPVPDGGGGGRDRIARRRPGRGRIAGRRLRGGRRP